MKLFQWLILAFLLSGSALINSIYAADDSEAGVQGQEEESNDTQDPDASEVQSDDSEESNEDEETDSGQ